VSSPKFTLENVKSDRKFLGGDAEINIPLHDYTNSPVNDEYFFRLFLFSADRLSFPKFTVYTLTQKYFLDFIGFLVILWDFFTFATFNWT
jgi:hypothetical protein